jgi:CO/xanthine dehydrogenase FAD-binding subunit
MIKAYYRPKTLGQALELISRSGIKTALLAGQSITDAHINDSVDEVVDLQAVGLKGIRATLSTLVVEALVPLQALVEHPSVPDALREVIRAEDTYTFRNMRTIGSLLGNPSGESQLIAAFLACDAFVNIETLTGSKQVGLSDFLRDVEGSLVGAILTTLSLDISGQISAAKVARTPADRPIVAAVARKTTDGQLRLAVSGVDKTPITVDPATVEQLQPPADFRGSSAYRRAMAISLSQRVVKELE